MCGIAGFVQPRDGFSADILERQLELLVHRGPDAAGHFGGRRGIIAQNRLAVIDLVTGDPPITNESGSVGAVLNGEIYNYRALRDSLLAEGHRFRSAGDTEAIVHLAEGLEAQAVARRLDGMFAFAVWDEQRERLILARDRLGKKPLYYWHGSGQLVFGSEIKAVLAHPAVPRSLDPGAVPAYLTFGYVPSPRSFFEGIQSLPPAHVLEFSPGGEPTILRYWEPPIAGVTAEPLDLSFDEAARRVRDSLTAAVRRRLVADVPLGAFLSGGIDSSAIVGVMAELLDRPVKTFTIGFDDREGFDERPHADAVARRFRTEHTSFVVRPDAVDLVERLLWHHDQPFGDSSAIPTFLLSELTREHVTVALSGDGGDELFAGYERFSAAVFVRQYRRLPQAARRAAEAALATLPATALRGRVGSARRFAGRAALGLPDAFLAWLSYVPEETRLEMLGVPDGWGIRDYRQVWSRSEGAALLDRLLDLNLRTYLLDDLLVKADRMSMAHALEVRSPFLDTELVELALQLPARHKLRGLSLKRVLKAAVRDLLPAEIVQRRKRGFGVPLDRWFRTDLRSYLESMVGAGTARLRSHVDGDTVDRLLGEHMSGARNHGHPLWALLTLELFLRREGW